MTMTTIGFGVVTEESIPRGEFIVEYTGELLYASDAITRQDRRYKLSSQLPQHHAATAFSLAQTTVVMHLLIIYVIQTARCTLGVGQTSFALAYFPSDISSRSPNCALLTQRAD